MLWDSSGGAEEHCLQEPGALPVEAQMLQPFPSCVRLL